jgi:hypothetical protein
MAKKGRAAKSRRANQKSYTEMKAEDFGNAIYEELGETIDFQLNGFVKSVVNDLTTSYAKKGVSPVLTGFFASSWKADIRRIDRTDYKEDFPEWKRIKYKFDPATRTTKLLPGYKPLIKQRHTVPTIFTRKKPVFIGNTTRYAPFAVISKKARINEYLQGGGVGGDSMAKKIDRFFSDKRPDIRIVNDVRFGKAIHDRRMENEPGYDPQVSYAKQ